jgi:hypothetical protein
LIVPVSGLFAPTESLPEMGADEPVRRPPAKTSLFAEPSGVQVGGTSSPTMAEVRARPPRAAHRSGTGSSEISSVFMSIRITRSFTSSLLE